LGLDLTIEVIPIEDDDRFQNQNGEALANLFLIRATAAWFDRVEGAFQNESVETWRYANLYRR